MNLFQKLIEVRKTVPYLKKDTEGYKYKYVTGADVLVPIVSKMNELGIILVSEIFESEHIIDRIEKTDKYNNTKIVEIRIIKANMLMTFINAEKPEEKLPIKYLCFGEQDDISKAFGSGLTYSERYFLMKQFMIPTDEDDPDKFQEKHNILANNGKKNGEKDEDKEKTEFKKKMDKNKELDNLLTILKNNFPSNSPKQYKDKLLDFVFHIKNWKAIENKDASEILKGTDLIKRMFADPIMNKRILGKQDGPLRDPEGEPISTDGEIEPPKNEFAENIKKIQAYKNENKVPEDIYRSAIISVIGEKNKEGKIHKGKANEPRTFQEQKEVIGMLEAQMKYLNKQTEDN